MANGASRIEVSCSARLADTKAAASCAHSKHACGVEGSFILVHPRALAGSFMKETGTNRSLAHASGSVGWFGALWGGA